MLFGPQYEASLTPLGPFIELRWEYNEALEKYLLFRWKVQGSAMASSMARKGPMFDVCQSV